jgi:hypothetical protein
MYNQFVSCGEAAPACMVSTLNSQSVQIMDLMYMQYYGFSSQSTCTTMTINAQIYYDEAYNVEASMYANM